MSGQNNITAFSGFGTWMSTFAPQENDEPKRRIEPYVYDVGRQNSAYVYELPAGNVESLKELDAETTNDKPPSPPSPQPPEKPPRPPPGPVHMPRRKMVSRPQNLYKRMSEPMSTIQIQGLQKIGEVAKSVDVISISTYALLSQLNGQIQRKGYMSPVAYLNQAHICLPASTPVNETNCEPWRVLVTTDKSNYDPHEGFRLHVDEPFSTFLSRVQVSVKCVNSKLLVNDGDLKIGIHRTLRVPEDGRVHLLPADFGLFPTHNLASYSKKLLASNNPSLVDMAKKTGVFFPIFQREALWLSFESPKGSEYAIRVFVGGVNVVSGKKWDAPVKLDDNKQDYIIVPHQKHLDGITVGNGIVRQFIAMPTGSGYSIEKQMTGKEDVGGVQLEITPISRKLGFRFANGAEIYNEYASDAETATPRDYHIVPGQDILIEREGVGAVWLGGQHPTSQNRYLRELLLPSPNGVQVLTAVYNIKLRITVHGRLRKHVVETTELSPFERLSEVAKKTAFKNSNLQSYDFYDYKGTLLSRTDTLVRNDLHVNGTITAKKSSKNYAVLENVSGGYSYAPSIPSPRPGLSTSLEQPNHVMFQTAQSYSSNPPHRMSGPPTSSAPPTTIPSHPGPQKGHAQLQQLPANQPVPYAVPSAPSTYVAELPAMTYSRPPPSTTSAPSEASPNSYAAASNNFALEVEATPAQQSYGAPVSAQVYPPYGTPGPQDFARSSTPAQQAYSSPAPQAYNAYDIPASQAYASQSQSAPSPAMSASLGMGSNKSSPNPQYGRSSYYNPDTLPAHSTPETVAASPSSASSTPTLVGSPHPSFSFPTPSNPPLPPRKPSLPARRGSPPAPQSWAMNLAPGGLIKQEIRQDTDIYRQVSLNKTATTLLSIQLLNSVAYEAITGMACPPTPITMADYVKAGIPWFDNYKGQTAATEGAMNFAGIRSVAEMDVEKGVDASTSVAESQNVACTVCRRNFCDCVLRPCNHAFCAECVKGAMGRQDWRTGRAWVECRVCGREAWNMVGFSAPMALPGMENYSPDLEANVVVLAGCLEKNVFELA